MNQIVLHGPGDWRLDDLPVPNPGPRDAMVRIRACGICGTDVSYVRTGGFSGRPIPLGHEMAGEVAWVGSEVPAVTVGDRVIVCPSDTGTGPIGTGGAQGGLTPLLHVPDAARGRRLIRVPDHMPLTTAALAEPLAVGMQAVNQSAANPGEKVAVVGCGPIGLMSIATLADRGIDDVVAIDLSRPRLELAKQVGADARAGPHGGRYLGGAQADSRHCTLHVRAYGRHRRVHRGLRCRQRARRRPASWPGRRPPGDRRPALPTRPHQLRGRADEAIHDQGIHGVPRPLRGRRRAARRVAICLV